MPRTMRHSRLSMPTWRCCWMACSRCWASSCCISMARRAMWFTRAEFKVASRRWKDGAPCSRKHYSSGGSCHEEELAADYCRVRASGCAAAVGGGKRNIAESRTTEGRAVQRCEDTEESRGGREGGYRQQKRRLVQGQGGQGRRLGAHVE